MTIGPLMISWHNKEGDYGCKMYIRKTDLS